MAIGAVVDPAAPERPAMGGSPCYAPFRPCTWSGER